MCTVSMTASLWTLVSSLWVFSITGHLPNFHTVGITEPYVPWEIMMLWLFPRSSAHLCTSSTCRTWKKHCVFLFFFFFSTCFQTTVAKWSKVLVILMTCCLSSFSSVHSAVFPFLPSAAMKDWHWTYFTCDSYLTMQISLLIGDKGKLIFFSFPLGTGNVGTSPFIHWLNGGRSGSRISHFKRWDYFIWYTIYI